MEGTKNGKMWVVLEPLTHLSSPLEAHIVPDDDVIDPLWVIYLARWYQQVTQAIQEGEETGLCYRPLGGHDGAGSHGGSLQHTLRCSHHAGRGPQQWPAGQ